jgi:hypothetical protein
MTYRRDYFWNYQDVKINPIYSDNDTTHTPQVKGLVKLFLPVIGETWISNVCYVPTFKKKMLSLVTI